MVPAKIFACECPEYEPKELDKVSYDWSDIILIGIFLPLEQNIK